MDRISPPPVTVRRLATLRLPDPAAAIAGIKAIFFEAAAVTAFPDATARAAFRERWLGRYLDHDAGLTHVALDGHGTVVGYVVGSHDDPARATRFADIPYFADLAEVTARYPAHLHVNVATAARSRGVGAALIAAFVADVAAACLPGVHVVTGQGMRNVGFYTRLGFAERAVAAYGGRPVVLLGRDLVSTA
jgi:GNAT superfamily N-acetyltransferase